MRLRDGTMYWLVVLKCFKHIYINIVFVFHVFFFKSNLRDDMFWQNYFLNGLKSSFSQVYPAHLKASEAGRKNFYVGDSEIPVHYVQQHTSVQCIHYFTIYKHF